MALNDVVAAVETADPRLQEMMDRANEMARYYIRGIPQALQGILINAEFYVSQEREEDLLHANGMIGHIKAVYEKIPFESLTGREEFYPLFVIRDLLLEFYSSADQIFKCKSKEEFDLDHLHKTAIAITETGKLYSRRLLKLIYEIRTYPGHEDFKISSSHIHNGRIMKLPLELPR